TGRRQAGPGRRKTQPGQRRAGPGRRGAGPGAGRARRVTGPAVRDPAGSAPGAGRDGGGAAALRGRARLRPTARLRPGTGRRRHVDLPGVAPARHRRVARASRVALASVLLLAVAGQARVWATGRGLWGDELAISINLQERAFTELPGRLLYYQVAPVGWLATGKAILVGLGDDERLLRSEEHRVGKECRSRWSP